MKLWKILALTCALCSGTAQANENSWVTITHIDEDALIAVFFRHTEPKPERFTLEAVKVGPSGTSVNKQGGSLQGQQVGDVLIRSRISLETGAILKVKFQVFSKGAVSHTEMKEVRL